MSRVSYGESDDPLDWGRWEQNTRATINGKKGQKLLREIEEALLALPKKRLIAGSLCSGGDYCVVGSLAHHRGISDEQLQTDPENDAVDYGLTLGLSYTLSWNLMERNDQPAPFSSLFVNEESPEDRYERVLKWVQKHIKREAAV